MLKECYILDKSRGYVFYGSLNTDLIGTQGYEFYEVSESNRNRPLKVIDGVVIVDYQKEYDDKVNYQKQCFKEFKDEILKQISYADAIGATDTVSTLKQQLATELANYESRVNEIVKEVE